MVYYISSQRFGSDMNKKAVVSFCEDLRGAGSREERAEVGRY